MIGFRSNETLAQLASASSYTFTLASTTITGDFLIGTYQLGSNVAVNSVTDNAGSVYTFTAPVQWDAFGVYVFVFYLTNANAGATTLTISLGSAAAGNGGALDRYFGVNRVHASVGLTENDTVNPGLTLTTTISGCIIWAINWASVTATAPSGFAARDSTPVNGLVTADLIVQTAPGAITPVFTEAAGSNILANYALAPTPPPLLPAGAALL